MLSVLFVSGVHGGETISFSFHFLEMAHVHCLWFPSSIFEATHGGLRTFHGVSSKLFCIMSLSIAVKDSQLVRTGVVRLGPTASCKLLSQAHCP
jgi:hypothetical protein